MKKIEFNNGWVRGEKFMIDKDYKEELMDMIKGLSKEEAIKELEQILFLIQQDDYMNWGRYYACKEMIKEVLKDE